VREVTHALKRNHQTDLDKVSEDLQYGARDKFLPGVVGGRMVIKSIAITASADGELGVKVKRIARETRAICCELLSRRMSLTSH